MIKKAAQRGRCVSTLEIKAPVKPASTAKEGDKKKLEQGDLRGRWQQSARERGA